MALTKEQKNEFNEGLTDFKVYLEELKKESNLYKMQMKKSKSLEPYMNIALATNSVKMINTIILVNELSVNILKINANNYLELGKKEISNMIAYVDKACGNELEGSLTENEEYLANLGEFKPLQRLNLLKAMGDTSRKLMNAFGSNSKWKWFWPDIYFKLTVNAKNLFDFKAYEKGHDQLSDPDHYVYREHFNLIVESANSTAQFYRQKFDMATQDVGDLKNSILMLDLNRRIFQITGEKEDLEKTKVLLESLKDKVESLETDDKKKKKKK